MAEVVRGRQGAVDVGLVGAAAGERAERLELATRTFPLRPSRSKRPRASSSGSARTSAEALVDRRRDDQVDLAVLVLEQHEDDAVRGRRALPRDGHARDRDLRAVRAARQLARSRAIAGRQVRAQQLERVDADREADVWR